MSQPTIIVDQLSKAYRIQQRQTGPRTLYGDMFRMLTHTADVLRGRGGLRREVFWALKDVSFTLNQGEVLGIIGKNGAGKSTLLKILSRITDPSSGTARIYGRVGSLLEVGTGFNPELTGRENVFLNGTILGLSRKEVQRHLDEIIDFAEIEQFIDTPVKHYSSGMHVRLGFAVAAHLEPEILLVDEVLAVGDVAFQRKCLDRIGSITRDGRTVLLVSHNMNTIRHLCLRAIVLSEGKIIWDGDAGGSVDRYLQEDMRDSSHHFVWDQDNAPGNDVARLFSMRLCGADGYPRAEFTTDEPIYCEFMYEIYTTTTGFRMAVGVNNMEGIYILYSAQNERSEYAEKSYSPGRYLSRCVIPPNLLNGGKFFIVASGGQRSSPIFQDLPRLELKVRLGVRPDGMIRVPQSGVVAPILAWQVQPLVDVQPQNG